MVTSGMKTQAHEFLFRSTADGILVANRYGFIDRLNPAAASMLNVTQNAVLGTKPEQTFRGNNALLDLFTSTENERTAEVRLPKRRLAVGIATTLENGERIVLLQDVTEARDLESRRESLISTITHDLTNPLSAVSGFADLVARLGTLNDQQMRYLTRVRQTSDKLYDVIGTLVDLAWIEAGMPMPHLPIKLGKTISEVVQQLSVGAHERKISIAVSVQDPMPMIMGDPERIRMVVYHLLDNAIVYSKPEQTVAIHAWGDPQEVYCSIADQGIGIYPDELELIFDRMYRSRDERVRDIPGGGLGLTIARKIITRHGGAIWATSNLDAGSTFTFNLPAVHL